MAGSGSPPRPTPAVAQPKPTAPPPPPPPAAAPAARAPGGFGASTGLFGGAPSLPPPEPARAPGGFAASTGLFPGGAPSQGGASSGLQSLVSPFSALFGAPSAPAASSLGNANSGQWPPPSSGGTIGGAGTLSGWQAPSNGGALGTGGALSSWQGGGGGSALGNANSGQWPPPNPGGSLGTGNGGDQQLHGDQQLYSALPPTQGAARAPGGFAASTGLFGGVPTAPARPAGSTVALGAPYTGPMFTGQHGGGTEPGAPGSAGDSGRAWAGNPPSGTAQAGNWALPPTQGNVLRSGTELGTGGSLGGLQSLISQLLLGSGWGGVTPGDDPAAGGAQLWHDQQYRGPAGSGKAPSLGPRPDPTGLFRSPIDRGQGGPDYWSTPRIGDPVRGQGAIATARPQPGGGLDNGRLAALLAALTRGNRGVQPI
jgi:hypothetical protein